MALSSFLIQNEKNILYVMSHRIETKKKENFIDSNLNKEVFEKNLNQTYQRLSKNFNNASVKDKVKIIESMNNLVIKYYIEDFTELFNFNNNIRDIFNIFFYEESSKKINRKIKARLKEEEYNLNINIEFLVRDFEHKMLTVKGEERVKRLNYRKCFVAFIVFFNNNMSFEGLK